MAFQIEEFCRTSIKDRIFGARALHQLSTYMKAIALRDGETVVTEEHYEVFKHLSTYFNYDCSLMLAQPLVDKAMDSA
jgi:hypothetical protein